MLSVSVARPVCLQKPLALPLRHMFGPGPSNVPPRILEAGANPVIGHMHPEIFEVINRRVDEVLTNTPHGTKKDISQYLELRRYKAHGIN